MRGKKAKALRREAEAVTVQKPAVAYGVIKHVRTVKTEDGPVKVVRPQLVLRYNCTRFGYKALKRGIRNRIGNSVPLHKLGNDEAVLRNCKC